MPWMTPRMPFAQPNPSHMPARRCAMLDGVGCCSYEMIFPLYCEQDPTDSSCAARSSLNVPNNNVFEQSIVEVDPRSVGLEEMQGDVGLAASLLSYLFSLISSFCVRARV